VHRTQTPQANHDAYVLSWLKNLGFQIILVAIQHRGLPCLGQHGIAGAKIDKFFSLPKCRKVKSSVSMVGHNYTFSKNGHESIFHSNMHRYHIKNIAINKRVFKVSKNVRTFKGKTFKMLSFSQPFFKKIFLRFFKLM